MIDDDRPRISHAESYYIELLRESWNTLPPRAKRRFFKKARMVYLSIEGLVNGRPR
jgi:hypothetical protein